MHIELLTPKEAVSFNEVARIMKKCFTKLGYKCQTDELQQLFIPNPTLAPLGFGTWDILIIICTIYDTPTQYFQLYSNFTYTKKAWWYGVVEGHIPENRKPPATPINNKIIVPSKFCKQMLEEQGYKIKAIIPHAIDHEEFKPTEQSNHIANYLREKFKGHKILLTIGHLTSRKAIPQLLKAIYYLKQKRQDFVLVLQTDRQRINQSIENQPPITQIIKRLNIEHFVYITEWQFGELSRSHLIGLYQAADIYILPSYTEGFGITLLEAGALKKPIITINAPPMNEIYNESQAYLVPYTRVAWRPDNPIMIYKWHIWEPQQMAETLDYALSNPKETEEKGYKAYERSLEYNYMKVYPKWLELE